MALVTAAEGMMALVGEDLEVVVADVLVGRNLGVVVTAA